MLAFSTLIAVAATLPPWTQKVGLNAPDASVLEVRGQGAPNDLVLVKGSGGVTLRPTGPARLEIELYVLVLKHGPQRSVTINLQFDTGASGKVLAPGQPNKQWKLPSEALFGLGRSVTTTVKVGKGTHSIELRPADKRTLGIALKARLIADPSLSDAEIALAPIPPGGGGDEPDLLGGGDDGEPALPDVVAPVAPTGPAQRLPASPPTASPPTKDSEPDLLGADEPALPETPPAAPPPPVPPAEGAAGSAETLDATPAPTTPGFTLRGEYAPSRVRGPGGEEAFLAADLSRGIDIDAQGPGTLVLELHAHRAAGAPGTTAPIVLALLTDEVLQQTIALTHPVTPLYEAVGASYALSWRTQLRIPLPAAAQHVQLTLSENAVYGVSFRPSFDPTTSVGGPVLTAERPVEISSTVAAAPADAPDVPWRGGGAVLAGVWVPVSLRTPGLAVVAEGTLGLPIAAVDLAFGLELGLQWAQSRRRFADPRQPDGRGEAGAVILQVPITLGLRYLVRPFDFLHLQIGLGGGALVTTGQTNTANVSGASSTGATGVAAVHLSGLVPLGPGELEIRAALQLAPSFATASVRNLSGGGGVLSVGYRFGRAFGG